MKKNRAESGQYQLRRALNFFSIRLLGVHGGGNSQGGVVQDLLKDKSELSQRVEKLHTVLRKVHGRMRAMERLHGNSGQFWPRGV